MRHVCQERHGARRVGAKRVQHHGLGIYAHPRGLRRHRVAMEGIGKERRFDEELARGCGAEEQQSAVEGAPFEPQPPFFDEINSSDFITLPKQHLVSSERSPFERVLVEGQHFQHAFAMKPLISSGPAKITSARSSIIPAPTSAGAPFCGPSSLTSVLKRKFRSQKSRTFPSAVATL